MLRHDGERTEEEGPPFDICSNFFASFILRFFRKKPRRLEDTARSTSPTLTLHTPQRGVSPPPKLMPGKHLHCQQLNSVLAWGEKAKTTSTAEPRRQISIVSSKISAGYDDHDKLEVLPLFVTCLLATAVQSKHARVPKNFFAFAASHHTRRRTRAYHQRLLHHLAGTLSPPVQQHALARSSGSSPRPPRSTPGKKSKNHQHKKPNQKKQEPHAHR